MPGIIIPLILALLATPVIIFLIIKGRKKSEENESITKSQEDNKDEYLKRLEKASTELIELLNKSIDERLYQESFDADRYKEMFSAFVDIALLIPYEDRSYVNDGVLNIPEIDGHEGRFYRGIVKESAGVLKKAKELFDSEKNERNKNNAEEGLSHVYPSDIELDNFVSNASFEVTESQEYLTAIPPLRAFKYFADAQRAFAKKLKEEKDWGADRANGQVGYTTKFNTYALLAKIIRYGILQRFSEGNRSRVSMEFVSSRMYEIKKLTTCEELYNFEPRVNRITNCYKALDWLLTKNPDLTLKHVDFDHLYYTFVLRDNDKSNYGNDMPFERLIEVDGFKELLSNPRVLSNIDPEFKQQLEEFHKKWNEQFKEFDRQKELERLQKEQKILDDRREMAIGRIRADAEKMIPAGGVNIYLVEYQIEGHRFECFISDSMAEVKEQFVDFFRKRYNSTKPSKVIISERIVKITCINYMFK